MERLSDKERGRLGELLAKGAPAWRMHQEVHRWRWAIRRGINALQWPPRREPRRSPLRLSLVEREEISRGPGGTIETMTEVDRPIERRVSVLDRAQAGRDRVGDVSAIGSSAPHQYRLLKAGVGFAEVLRRRAGTEVPRARPARSRRPVLGEAV